MTALLVGLLLAQSGVTTTGYLDSRTTTAATQRDGAAGLTQLVEGNVQLKFDAHERFKLYTDASLFWQQAAYIHGGDRDLPTFRPQVVLAEAYVDAPLQDHFRLLVGKKRIVWGAGLAFNPTDLLNPPKDPTDPTFQRAGAWLAQAEWAYEKVAVSVVAAGAVTRQYAGLPTALIFYPEQETYEQTRGWAANTRDDEAHVSVMARLYLLLADTDVNLIYGYTNLYNDAFKKKSKVGFSLSRVFGNLEVHAEGLFYTGASRLEANPDCVEAPMACALRGETVASRPHLEAEWLNAKVVAGGRYQFDDSSFLSLEYYFNGEGLSEAKYRDLAYLALSQPLVAQQLLSGGADPGTPQKFAFEPFRRHYAVLQYQKPQIADDFTLGLSALVGLEDLSAQVVPMVQWMPKEWLQLTLAAYVPIAGLTEEGVAYGDETFGQLTLSPQLTRVMLQARAFF
jgi:hypothetical protein